MNDDLSNAAERSNGSANDSQSTRNADFVRYSIRLDHETFSFCAAHFITFAATNQPAPTVAPNLKNVSNKESSLSSNGQYSESCVPKSRSESSVLKSSPLESEATNLNVAPPQQSQRPQEPRSSDSSEIEPLHGHDFRVRATVFGPLNRDCCVLDFVTASEILKKTLARLNHKILLATEHPQFQFETSPAAATDESNFAERLPIERSDRDSDSSVEVRFRRPNGRVKRWVFPREDVLFIPTRNITTEELARFLAVRFFEKILNGGLFQSPPEDYNLLLELEESRGMSANVYYNLNAFASSVFAYDDLFAPFSWRR